MSRLKFGYRPAVVLMALFLVVLAGSAAFSLLAAFSPYVYPPDKEISLNRTFEPADFSTVGEGGVITVTIDVVNNEAVTLRGFYFSDQVPNGWSVSTADVSVNEVPIGDYTYGQGAANEIYTGFTPHRWTLEMPQGGGVFSPTHAIAATGGTAQIVYTMMVSGGAGGDYAPGQEGWAGWLTTASVGTAVFGYEIVPLALEADFSGSPRFGSPPLVVTFADLSVGDILTWTWDFGDEGTAALPGPAHTYAAPGYYTVTLTVEDAYGADTLAWPRYIHVTDTMFFTRLPLILKSYGP